MEGFETKKALLVYLGKDENDRKLVDRMILRGEVYMEDGMYYLSRKEDRLKELELLVEKLRGEIATIKESNWDYEEAKAQWDYWETKCRRYGKYMIKVIEVTYNRIKPMLGSKLEWMDEFKEHILEEVREICGNDD